MTKSTMRRAASEVKMLATSASTSNANGKNLSSLGSISLKKLHQSGPAQSTNLYE